MSRLHTALFVLFCFLAAVVRADFWTFEDQTDILQKDIAIWAPSDAPAASGDGSAYINFDISFTSSRPFAADQGAMTEVVVFPYTTDRVVGYPWTDPTDGQTKIMECCTQELFGKAPGCFDAASLGHLIVNEDAKYEVRTAFPSIGSEQATVSISKSFPITKSALYSVVIGNCKADTTYTGRVEFKNPYGYLPGDVYMYLPFYEYLCITLLILGAFWFVFNALYWTELVTLQFCVTGVVFMLMVETATWYFDFTNWNNTGVRNLSAFMFGTTLLVFKRAVSRMLVVAVALGYGIVKRTLGDDALRIYLTGGLYFMFALALELTLKYYSAQTGLSSTALFLLILPVGFMDTFIFWWIFASLGKVMYALKERKQMIKYNLYLHFSYLLTGALLLGAGIYAYYLYFLYTNKRYTEWKILWLFDDATCTGALWQMLYVVTVVGIMLLWRPDQNSRRYAYAEVQSSEDDEVVELIGSSMTPNVVAKRDKNRSGDMETGTLAQPNDTVTGSSAEPTTTGGKKKIRNGLPSVPVFEINDDPTASTRDQEDVDEEDELIEKDPHVVAKMS